MSKKINVGILFGGRSVEHEVSVQSAKNVYDAIDKDKFNVIMIGISKDGRWLINPQITNEGCVTGNHPLALVPGSEGSQLIDIEGNNHIEKLDVIFPILHGPYGEDGTMQGLLKLMNIPFVGPSVLGSAVGMDKEVMKRLLKDCQIPSAKYLVMNKYIDDVLNPTYEEAKTSLGIPFFVKPASLGSSVGISKINSKEEFERAITEAFKFDLKLIIETNIVGKEIECSVLGNEKPMASLPGEVKSNHDFYSYEAKYLDENGAGLEIPAKLKDDTIKKIQELAVKTFKALYCEGLTRVDFFVTEQEEILINEVNTLPGFTKISMYPKLWEATGISYTLLIDRLIQYAIERYDREAQLATSI
ncbi:MAG: D-alanine--D-alanine ligase [Firmicutes bacterium HGW-Firmicutes-1]|jgi:D-alanine-D-alanine ligase|nr:MAG: D-alanine--D-alanine ligase [Firmicutes bacterium HGW-Firmicutes-1]